MTPLTIKQQQSIDDLVTARRLDRIPADAARATIFLHNAQRALIDVPHLTQAQNRFNLAYDACHDIGESLLIAYGYRTTNGPGQHDALGRYLRAVLNTPPGSHASQRFDQLRRGRNQQRYEASIVGEADANLAETTARGLLAAAITAGVSL